MYGHIKTLAEAEARGVEKAGVKCDLWQIEETLPKEVLQKMYAPTEQTGHQVNLKVCSIVCHQLINIKDPLRPLRP